MVSWTLIDKEKGIVTLFAFDEGEGLSEHTALFDALFQVYDVRASVVISGEPHALRALTPFKMMLVMIRA